MNVGGVELEGHVRSGSGFCVTAEADGAVTLIQQARSGKFRQEGPLAGSFSEAQDYEIRNMFARFNSRVARDGGFPPGTWWRRPPGDTITVCLVACGGSKQEEACAAKDMYTGGLFVKSREWAEFNSDEWAILSAKHFLLDPEKVIEPYDAVVGKRGGMTQDAAIRFWASQVNFQCYRRWGEDTFYVVLGGEKYRAPFELYDPRNLGRSYYAPLKGLGIGEQLGWLKRELQAIRGAGRSRRRGDRPPRLL